MGVNVLPLIALGAEAAFYLLLLAFTIHAVILTYHWFKYGTERKRSTRALAIYLLGGAVLFISMALVLARM